MGFNAVAAGFRDAEDMVSQMEERARTAEALAQQRLATASEFAELQRALSGNPGVDEIRKRLDGLIQRINPK
jgi:hypothetical protein